MTARLALALLFIVPAAMAYPYETTTQRWVLGVAVAVVIVLFAWWGGDFATTKLARRWSIWRGNRAGAEPAPEPADTATVVLRIEESAADELPVALIAGYAARYGLRCDKVRITSRDRAGERRTWVSLTLDAAQNLQALQARSSRIPLRETADVMGRRLADHLRESGWTVSVLEVVPRPVSSQAKETWRALGDESGFLTAYRIPAGSLPAALDAVWALPSDEIWTAVEFGPETVTGAAAVRSAEQPGAGSPVAGLLTLGGRQRQVLDSLDPRSSQRLPGHEPAGSVVEQLRWPAGSAVRT
ncbi:type VII secretion protein EccE [Mycobacterium sp. AMU20-3851]|uniref:type VII secretion protein EccE n=1 Tax=Mycobacterium sp. AMU20-3851 TaxID=3122055 RepID=UPI003754E3E6